MGNYISGMRVALRVVLVAAAAIGCFGAEVFSLDGEGAAPAPAPAGGGGSATFQPLTDEIARAKAAEAALDTKIDGSDAARKTDADGLLGRITAAETMIAAETTAKDKLATDTAAAQKAMEDSLKKATDDAATKETASASALAGMKKTVDAETTNRQDGDSRVRRELETKVNENRAGETKSLESRDGKMVSTVKALGDKLSQEATASNTVITQQASELKALTAKVLQMETKVAGLTAGKKPASTPPAL